MSARRFSLASSETFDRDPTATNRVLPSAVEFQVARPVAPAADLLAPAGDVVDDHLRGARRLHVAVAVREADDRSGVAHIQIFRFGAGGIERDPEGPRQPGGEDLVDLRFAVAVGVAEDADAIGPALGQEQVAVGRAHDHTRLGQAGGELGDLKALGDLGPGSLAVAGPPAAGSSPRAFRMGTPGPPA